MSNTRRPRNPQLGNQQRATSTAVVVGVVVAVCIAAIVVIGLVINRGGDDANTASGGAATPSASVSESTPTTPDTSNSSAPPSNLDCTTAPEPPAKPQQFHAAPDKGLAKDTTWTATVKTNCGDITLELDGAQAPQTVSSFIYLAQKGYYDDSPCHRLTTSGIYVLQCGDPTGGGSGGPGYTYGIENAPADGDYPTGSLAMARTSDPNSNGSQFFIVYQNTQLPTDGGGYSIFGKVTGGLDLLRTIAAAGVAKDDPEGDGDGAPAQPVSILSISVQER
jgi:peptidyl-prolyl cis-trans isomerase B (cyclophilin B)